MAAIYYTVLLAVLWLHLAVVAVVLRPWLGGWALARAAGLLVGALGLFFIEHFVGLGRLGWVLPFSTAASLGLLWQHCEQWRGGAFWRAEGVFAAAMAYGLLWKLFFPSIYPTSERVTDLYFIVNYLDGERLPPLDHWFPPYRFDFYYAFQHYGAALLGRVMPLTPGQTYNLAFVLLMAVTLALAWEFARFFVAKRLASLLVVAALAVGGTGASLATHLAVQPAEGETRNWSHDMIWGAARFVGNFDQRSNTDIGRRLFIKDDLPEGFKPRELPLENFGYQFYLGDYHPPLGGFALLLMALVIIATLERGTPHPHLLYALLAATVPVSIATNTWVFPLQALLAGGWFLWRYHRSRRDAQLSPDWGAFIAGGLVAAFLLLPFLQGFAIRAESTPFRWVQWQDHTSILPFIAQFWPLLLLIGVGLFRREAQGLTRAAAVFFLVILALSEMFYIDDPTGGHFLRTNSTMKWWGWLWTGGMVALGALLLASSARWVRGVAIATLLLPTAFYGADLVRYWKHFASSKPGPLTADEVYVRDAAVREMFRFLAAAPKGIVLENQYGHAFHDGGVYAAFAAKPSYLGWPMHLQTWHGYQDEIWIRNDQTKAFYSGTMTDPVDWLLVNQIDYIVWNGRDATEGAAHWSALATALSPTYAWRRFGGSDEAPVGLWLRISSPSLIR